MKKIFRAKALCLTVLSVCGMAWMFKQDTLNVSAATEYTIADGVYVEGMNMSGMTKAQATTAIESYV